MKYWITLIAAMSLGGPHDCSSEAPEASRPNILYIVVDDMGYSDIGAFGSEIPGHRRTKAVIYEILAGAHSGHS